MTLIVERTYPALLGILSALAWWYFLPNFPRDEKEFLGAAISVGSILTGFIATAKAILAALPNDSVMSRLKSSGYIHDLASYLTQALYGCLLFSIYGMAGFFFLNGEAPSLNKYYATGWIFMATYALFSFHRVASVLMKVITFNSKN